MFVGTLGSIITQGVNTVAGPFHPFGGAVDIIVVLQEDGTFKSSPWYVKFGKFQGILKREKVVDVRVNDVATDFHMYLDHKGEAFFEKEVQLDDHTILSLPSAPLSGDGMTEFGETKFLTFEKDSTAKGFEMQELSNRDSDTNAVSIFNEGNNPKSGMPDDGTIEQVDTASTVCVSDALVNQPNSEVVIAPSQTNSYMVEGQDGTANSNKKTLKKEESRAERSGKRPANRSESIFGRVFRRKSEQVSPSSSAHGGRQTAGKGLQSTPSMERAEMVADLLDRKWAVGCKEILMTPTKRWQNTAASTGVGTDSSPLVGTGSLMHGSEGSAVVVNEASSGQSGSGEFSRPETVAEGSKQSTVEESKLAETGISMHGSEGSAVVMKEEVSSGQSGWGEFLRPETLVDVVEPPTMENLAIDGSRINMMRLESFTQSREYAGEKVSEKDRFLNSTLEEPTSILGSHERSGDVSSSSDSLCNTISEGGVQNGRCNGANTTNEEVAPLGMSDEGVDRSTECVSGTEVVLMSGDDHIITAPVNFEICQLHSNEYGQHVDSSKEFPHGAFCNHDVQVVGSSSDDSENLESDGRKQPAVVSCSSAFGMLEVGVDSGLNQLGGKSEGPVKIEEVSAGPLDDEVDAGRASEFTSENMKVSSLEMTPEFVSELEHGVFEDNQRTSFQIPQLKSEHSVVTALTAGDRCWEERDACVPDDPVVPKFITGQDGMDLQSEPGMNTDHLGTASSCMLDDGISGSRKLATSGSMETGTVASSIGDKWAPMHIEADSTISTDVDLSRSIELRSEDLQSPGQKGLEHFSSFNGGHSVDLKNEESEADVFKNCLYLEELANLNGDNNAVAFLEVGHKDDGGGDNATAVSEVDDPVLEEWREGNNLSLSKAVDFDQSEQPFINMDARPGTRTRYRSKPVAVPRCAIKKKVELTSSASVPSTWYEAEREVHVYSRSVGSSPLFNTHQLHMKADATDSFKKDMNESSRAVDLVDRQVIEAIIYGSGKDSAVIVNAADDGKSSHIDVDLSVCRHLLSDGMGGEAAARAFASHKVSYEDYQRSGSAIFADDKLVVKIGERYFSWVEAAPYIVNIGASGSEAVYKMEGGIAVETNAFTKDAGSQTVALAPSPTKWKLWPFSVRGSRGERVPRFASTVPTQALLTATNVAINSPLTQQLLQKNGYYKRSPKFKVRTFVPTSGQLASLKLKEGSNKVTFTPVLGRTQVDARIYLWKWNTRIVVSDVDGTITKSDVLGQVMPLVGRDWTQSGVTRLFSAIKDNGYEFLFLSARAISQAYLTRQFLLNLKQDGAALPDGPVFISPDGLIPSLYREVIRRAPHEFKISCLERVRELFPSDVNPFYAGFGNRDTDEISYLKVGIPKGKINLINPKGQVLVNHHVDTKSYSSLHTLVDDMFPPMSSVGQEDFNSWNFWKLPLPDIDDESSVNSARSTRRGGGSKR